MKKRILALLLAGLITASMASCVATGNQDEPGNDTEADQTLGNDTTTAPTEDETDPGDTEWTVVDETVFTLNQVSLREEPDTSGTVVKALAKEIQLHRTKVSEDWSYVETADGESGYVSNRYITAVNILGTDFTAVEGGEKIMYATDVVNVRLYPSADDKISDKKGAYQKDDEVTVVATNGKWYRVKFKTESDGTVLYYYVNASYLANEKGASSNDASQYESLFTALEIPEVKYTNAKVNVRTTPVAVDNDNLIVTLEKGAKVVVLKTGTVDGQGWSYVNAEVAPVKEGDPSTKVEGYVSSAYLTAEVAPESLTLDELIERYPSFTKLTKTVYVVKEKSLKVRSTPEYLEDDSNYVDTLNALTKVEVVAQGKTDLTWYIIKYVDEDSKVTYRFTSASATYTTTDSTGEWKLTLENLTATYSDYVVLDEAITITATAKANGYTKPETAKEAPFSVSAGATAKLVAKESKASGNVWYVIQATDGTLYFVPMQYFTLPEAN